MLTDDEKRILWDWGEHLSLHALVADPDRWATIQRGTSGTRHTRASFTVTWHDRTPTYRLGDHCGPSCLAQARVLAGCVPKIATCVPGHRHWSGMSDTGATVTATLAWKRVAAWAHTLTDDERELFRPAPAGTVYAYPLYWVLLTLLGPRPPLPWERAPGEPALVGDQYALDLGAA